MTILRSAASAAPPALATPDTVDSSRAWAIAVAALLANAACWGTINTFGAFLGSMKDEFGAGLGATALIYAFPSFVLFSLGMFTGPLGQQYGPRRMVLFGAAVIGTGLYLTSRATSLPMAILAYGLGVGLGTACFLVPLTACIGGWFVRRRALAQGLAASGSGLGSLLVVPLARWLIDEYGWRQAYVFLAIMCSTVLLATAAVSKRPPNSIPAGRPSIQRIREAASKGPFLQVYLGGFFLTSALMVPFVFLVQYATDHGIDKRDAALLLSILGGSNIVCRLATTSLAGRVGATRLYLICIASLPVGLALWLSAGSSYRLLALFAVALGVSHGGYVALSPEVVANLFGVANIGTLLGALWTGGGVAGLLSPVLAGLLIDASGYSATIGAAFAFAVLAVVVQYRLWGNNPPTTARR